MFIYWETKERILLLENSWYSFMKHVYSCLIGWMCSVSEKMLLYEIWVTRVSQDKFPIGHFLECYEGGCRVTPYSVIAPLSENVFYYQSIKIRIIILKKMWNTYCCQVSFFRIRIFLYHGRNRIYHGHPWRMAHTRVESIARQSHATDTTLVCANRQWYPWQILYIYCCVIAKILSPLQNS